MTLVEGQSRTVSSGHLERCLAARARAAKQQQDLARVRAERDDLRGQAQLLARIVHVLEIENSKLKETNAALEQQVAAHTSVLDLTRRRGRP